MIQVETDSPRAFEKSSKAVKLVWKGSYNPEEKVFQNAKTPSLTKPDPWSHAYEASRLPRLQSAAPCRSAAMSYVLSPC